jgi:hypothetical protein
MQLSTVVPLEGKACVSLVRRSGEGSGSQRVRMGDSTRLRKMCSSARGAANSVKSVLTSDAGPDTLVSSHHSPFFLFLVWCDKSLPLKLWMLKFAGCSDALPKELR